jgi:hypothetical protein
MKDILNLFKREAEFDPSSVGNDHDESVFAKRRVLESAGLGETEGRGESTSRGARKAGSLGFRKERKEDSVYGRR